MIPYLLKKHLKMAVTELLLFLPVKQAIRSRQPVQCGPLQELSLNILEIQRDILLRAERYNRCLKRLERYEKEGRCLVIRPTKSKGFGKIEKDFNKILSMYNDGYNQTYSLINEIQRFYH